MAENTDIPASTSGSAAAAPTLPSEQSPAQASHTAAQSNATASEPKRDPAGSRSAEAERGARALQMLRDGKDPREVKKALQRATPDEDGRDVDQTHQTTLDAGAGDRSRAAAPPADVAPQSQTVTFDGLNAKQVQALGQAGLLPEPDEWKGLPDKVRQRMIASAKVIIAERTRNWQQSQSLLADRDQKGRFAPKGDDGSSAQPDDNEAGESQPPPARQEKQAQRGSAAEPVDSVAAIRKFAEQFGDEEIAKPLVAAFEAERTAHARELESRDRRLNYLQRTVLGREEKNAREALSKVIPNLQSDDALWQTVLDAGRVVAEASVKSGANWTWETILDQTGRAMFAEHVATAAQSRLADSRKESLQGTVDRAGNQTHPGRTMTKEERAGKALSLLKNGKSPREVRELLAG